MWRKMVGGGFGATGKMSMLASCFHLIVVASASEGEREPLCHSCFRSLEKCLQNDYGRLRVACSRHYEGLQACLSRDWRYVDEGRAFPRREGGFNRLRQCRHGLMLFNPLDWYIGRSLEVYGEWGQRKVDFFSKFLRPGQVVVEVGAHVGALTLALSRLVGPAGRVIALEPFYSSFAALAANTALNSLENVEVRQAVVADRPGKVFMDRGELAFKQQEFFNFGSMDFHELEIHDALAQTDRQSTAWDEYAVLTLEQLSLPQLDFVKIDAEAMESAVIKGTLPLLRKFRPLLFIEYRNPKQKNSELLRALKKSKYDCVLLRLPIFNSQNYRGHEEDIWGERGSVVNFDLFCKRKGHESSLSAQVLELFRTAVATDVSGLRTTPRDAFEIMSRVENLQAEGRPEVRPESEQNPTAQPRARLSRKEVEEMSLGELLDSMEASERGTAPKGQRASATNSETEMSLKLLLEDPADQPTTRPLQKELTLDDL
ncbi:unnamed protein product [Symbiodinium necroappetens]|uniref:Methyltransferase FkbM domain-containing protein n=1 Tax=Symbiodinium necroappetens TaxID=1628268 RepID=A0A812NU43_9DINO|nr:unnamed protein product [Symbiodinium necroappetens]